MTEGLFPLKRTKRGGGKNEELELMSKVILGIDLKREPMCCDSCLFQDVVYS